MSCKQSLRIKNWQAGSKHFKQKISLRYHRFPIKVKNIQKEMSCSSRYPFIIGLLTTMSKGNLNLCLYKNNYIPFIQNHHTHSPDIFAHIVAVRGNVLIVHKRFILCTEVSRNFLEVGFVGKPWPLQLFVIRQVGIFLLNALSWGLLNIIIYMLIMLESEDA